MLVIVDVSVVGVVVDVGVPRRERFNTMFAC